MEPFVLALSLGMIGPPMTDRHVQVQQPHRQRRVLLLVARRPPRRAIVGQDTPGKAVLAKHPLQTRTHGNALLVATGPHLQGVTGVIVQNRQRMTPSRCHGEVALEVHLPKVVRRRVLEPRPVARLASSGTIQTIVTPQDLGDRGRRRRIGDSVVFQHLADLAAAPGRMIGAHRQNLRLHRRRRARWTDLGPPRSIRQPSRTFGPVSRQPLVARRRGYPPTTAQLPHVRSWQKRQTTKLLPLVQQRTLLERHRRSSSPCP